MTLGPIVSSGTLAILIPPSALAVFIGAVGQVSIGRLLLAIIVPGLLVAALFAGYIIIRCTINPSLAPSYDVPQISRSEKVRAFFFQTPIGIIMLAVIGSVFTGIATPGESAALGVIACVILAVLYRKFNWQMIKESAQGTIQVTVMVFFIVVGSISFGRLCQLGRHHVARGLDYRTGRCSAGGCGLHPGRAAHPGLLHGPRQHRHDHGPDLLPHGQGVGVRHAVVRDDLGRSACK